MPQIEMISNQFSPHNYQQNNYNKFTTEDGEELMLHELEPVNFESDEASKLLWKSERRGRPRKDEDSSIREELKRQRIEAQIAKRLSKEERRERRRQIRQMEKENRKPIKRGRPRKGQTEHVEGSCSSFGDETHTDFDYFNTPITRNGAFQDEDEEPGSELKLLTDVPPVEVTAASPIKTSKNETPKPKYRESNIKSKICQDFEIYKWSPLQRLTQLNLGLAYTEMYTDSIFWDRISAEFIETKCILRLELGNEKVYELPFVVISNFFWIWAHLGVTRLQIVFLKVSEQIIEDEFMKRQLCLNSEEAFISSFIGHGEAMINQKSTQIIQFDENSKISNWTLRINSFDEFHNSTRETHCQDASLVWGFPKKLLDFLDVALVMSSLLPDASNWKNWLNTYFQQNIKRLDHKDKLSPEPSIQALDYFNNTSKHEVYEKESNYIFDALDAPSHKKSPNEDFPLPEFDLSQLNFEDSVLLQAVPIAEVEVGVDLQKGLFDLPDDITNLNNEFISELEFMNFQTDFQQNRVHFDDAQSEKLDDNQNHYQVNYSFENINEDSHKNDTEHEDPRDISDNDSQICDHNEIENCDKNSCEYLAKNPMEISSNTCDNEEDGLIVEIDQSGSSHPESDEDDDFFGNYS